MATDSPIPPLNDSLLDWRARHPDAAGELIEIVNKMAALSVEIVTVSNAAGFGARKDALIDQGDRFHLALALKLSESIADPTGGAVVDVECRAALAQLLELLRETGQLPTRA